MNLVDLELEISNKEITLFKKDMNNSYWFINLYAIVSIVLIITGHYCGYNWINGFGIGANFIFCIVNIFNYFIKKNDIEKNEIKFDFYSKIKARQGAG